MNENQKFEYLFKIVLIGDSNVGKTNILSRLIKNEVPSASKPTIGVEFGTKTFIIDKATIKAQIWDTAGQERYHAITSAYYRGSCGAVIVYDITNKASLENAVNIWLRNLKNTADPNIPIMLLGNKSDLVKERVIEIEQGKKLALTEQLGFFETSALNGENIQQSFEIFIKKIYEREKKKQQTVAKYKVRDEKTVGKTLEIEKKKKKSSCC